MKNLKEEIQRSKQLMGIAEGLNLVKVTPSSWFQSILNRTTGPYTTPDYPNSLFYRLDDEIIFKYDQESEILWVDYIIIWSVFEDRFGMEYDEIRELIKPMVEEHYKLGSVTPGLWLYPGLSLVEDHYKLESVTPFAEVYHKLHRWKNITN